MATVFFLGFDGTLTEQPFYETISSHYYAKLKNNYDLDYSFASFKSGLVEQFHRAFETDIKTYFPNESASDIKKYHLSPTAVDFLKHISENPDYEIVIITANRKEYVLALLQFHKLNTNPFKIYDLKNTPEKKAESIQEYINNTMDDKNTVVLCEDNKEDFNAMKVMLQGLTCIKNINHLVTACEKPGEFNWPKIEKEMQG